MIPAIQQIPLFENELLTFILIMMTICTGFFLPYTNNQYKQKIKDLESKLDTNKSNNQKLEELRNKINKVETICESSLEKSGLINAESSAQYYISTVQRIYQTVKRETPSTPTKQERGKVAQRKIIRRN
ncbi:MAG: hypothetical protein F6K40_12245 [Okeania sp. SIO3I5]|uniref:hypothetical protein n=1 Tax=Okeania sp. SIO3I5 TaxID=2607805 RepID=UPI0013BB25A3|nr:hypothetical protein [Okeania sp. SIO3I5]NEQ37000.1 hypothetical protein [Okeania sp. SIO3I5]